VPRLHGTAFGSGAITFAAPGGIVHFTPGSTALSNVISGLDAGDSLYFDPPPVNFSLVFFGVADTATLPEAPSCTRFSMVPRTNSPWLT
jgi:hypothetical protein